MGPMQRTILLALLAFVEVTLGIGQDGVGSKHLRQNVHASAGGVAPRRKGASIVLAIDRKVYFGGEPSIAVEQEIAG